MLEGKRYASKPFEYKYPKNGNTLKKFTGDKITCKLYRRKLPVTFNGNSSALILNRSSEDLGVIATGSIDLIFSDPPYYNNLAYSELSDFYHVWLKRLNLKSYFGNYHKQTPLKESLYVSQRNGKAGKTHERFSKSLTCIFSECHRVLKKNGLLVFTYHHNNSMAWAALAKALLTSGFHVTNVFPVRSEGQSRFHSDDGNIKWDEVIVCRKRVRKHLNKFKTIDEMFHSIEQQANHHLKYWRHRLKTARLSFNTCDARSLKSGVMVKYLSTVVISKDMDFENFFEKSYSNPKLQNRAAGRIIKK